DVLADADMPMDEATIAEAICDDDDDLDVERLESRIGAMLKFQTRANRPFAHRSGEGWTLAGTTAPKPTGEPMGDLPYKGTANSEAAQAVRDHMLLNPRRSAAATMAHQRPRRAPRSEGPGEPLRNL